MKCVSAARNAMATRFEIVLHGANEISLRAAAEEALNEIERVAARMSLYDPQSEISRINALAASETVRVEPGLFRLLELSKRLSEETAGAFDISILPLMRCWGFVLDTGRLPDPDTLKEARRNVGMRWVELDEDRCAVHFARDGVKLDLGAIAKGYAIERAAEFLVEAGVESGLLHGGTSTVQAIGSPPNAPSWMVAIPDPGSSQCLSASSTQSAPEPVFAAVSLKDEAMSVSAVWGKAFEAGGRVYGHVIDPRKGEPVDAAVLSAVVLPSAMETDALSTALLTMGLDGHRSINGLRAGMRSLVVARGEDGSGYRRDAIGIEVIDEPL